nr:hypothetical protein [Tanacetum cinerariifolium]
MKYPLGFTPVVASEVQSNAFNEAKMEADECLQNIHDEKVASEVKKTCPLSNPKEDKEGSICSEENEFLMNGEVVIMDDLSEVRKQAEGYGSIFNVQGDDAFNSFIWTVGLEEVLLCGCSFTCSLNTLTEEIVAYEKESDETHAIKKLDALCTPESFVTHSNFDTPGGTVYYILKKRMLNGDVRQNYLVCNRTGCPKGIHVDTLDLGNNYKEKRNSNLHITGCKAHDVFNLDTRTIEFILNVFDTIHNHKLEHEEFKHLLKRDRGSSLFGASVYCKSC